MTENEITNSKGNTGNSYNPISLGILFFGFALTLWTNEQISELGTLVIAIVCSSISFGFFVAVFSQHVLAKLNAWVVKPFVLFISFVFFLVGFITGWLQAFLKTSDVVSHFILYFGFAWIVTFLLTAIRDSKIKTKYGESGLKNCIQFIRCNISYLIIVAFLVIAGIRIYNHLYWDGAYLIGIAGLSISVARGWLKVQGGIFE